MSPLAGPAAHAIMVKLNQMIPTKAAGVWQALNLRLMAIQTAL